MGENLRFRKIFYNLETLVLQLEGWIYPGSIADKGREEEEIMLGRQVHTYIHRLIGR